MTDNTFTCPVCGLDNDQINGIYRHLLTAHRKSALANALLEAETQDDVSIRPGPDVLTGPRSQSLSDD